MKGNIDIISAVAGSLGAILKGKKMSKKTKIIIIDSIIGGVLGYAMVDLLEYFLSGLSTKVVIFISLICGTLAGELFEASEKVLNTVLSYFNGKIKGDGDNN